MKIRPRNPLKALLFILSCALPLQLVSASTDIDTRIITRGEAVHHVVDHFELKSRNRSFINQCEAQPHDCFFVFAAMSDFDDIDFEPLQLYPDVFPNDDHYDAINTASMLGLVHGYLDEETTPFRPNNEITRIQAVKIIFGAADIMKWVEKFELENELGVEFTSANWWYDRYLDFGVDNNIVPVRFYFEPDGALTVAELELLLNNTLAYKLRYGLNTETVAAGVTAGQTNGSAGEEV